MSNMSEAGVSPGVATCRDICLRVAVGAGMSDSILSGLRGDLLFFWLRVEPPGLLMVALLGVLHWETG